MQNLKQQLQKVRHKRSGRCVGVWSRLRGFVIDIVCTWVFPKIEVPRNVRFIMEKPIFSWMIWGVPLFLETSIYIPVLVELFYFIAVADWEYQTTWESGSFSLVAIDSDASHYMSNALGTTTSFKSNLYFLACFSLSSCRKLESFSFPAVNSDYNTTTDRCKDVAQALCA